MREAMRSCAHAVHVLMAVAAVHATSSSGGATGDRGQQEDRPLRGQAAVRGQEPRPHRDITFYEKKNCSRRCGRLHRRSASRRRLLRHRRARVHGGRWLATSRPPSAGRTSSLRQGVLDPAVPGGKIGIWALPSRRPPTSSLQPQDLKQLGVTIPASGASPRSSSRRRHQVHEGGYAAFATGPPTATGPRTTCRTGCSSTARKRRHPAPFKGELSWKDPRVSRCSLLQGLIDLGAYAKTLSSMTLPRRTATSTPSRRRACPGRLLVHGRAFVAPDRRPAQGLRVA